ncbi:hypothetical protein J6590_017043 [Homalodisca vitripennis]|nr:hypothetical protein J6590_017043 [Homalodisca vitripennis]
MKCGKHCWGEKTVISNVVSNLGNMYRAVAAFRFQTLHQEEGEPELNSTFTERNKKIMEEVKVRRLKNFGTSIKRLMVHLLQLSFPPRRLLHLIDS